MSASSNQLYFLLQRAAGKLKAEADAALIAAGGMTTAQAAVMMIIARDGPVTQNHIASTLSQRESAVTTMAARLVRANYITKIRSSDDARAWALEATDEGLRALRKVRSAFATINAKLDESLSARAIDEQVKNLRNIIKAFDQQ